MTVRDTSLAAYRAIVDNGWLGRAQEAVYVCLYHYGPLTAQEVFKRLGMETNQSGRFTELRDMGLIKEAGERVCTVTARSVIEWDVTSSTSITPVRKISEKQQLRNLLHAYVLEYPQSCGCHLYGRENCLMHRALDLINS